MSIVFSSYIPTHCLNHHLKTGNLKSIPNHSLVPLIPFGHGKSPLGSTVAATISRAKAPATKHDYDPDEEEDAVTLDLGDDETEVDGDGNLPWEGAIIYKRSSSVTSHVEYCTTLERLGLGRVSTEVSRLRASEMGIRVTRAFKDYPLGTPVQVSVDVTRKKKKLRLDRIIKTVLTLACNSCGEPAAQSIFSNFSLLLSSEPIEEPDVIDIGTLFGKNKNKTYAGIGEDWDEDDEASIDFDDRLYFPTEAKEIDISKHIRDLLHLEINISSVCGPNCKGMCMKCGTNWNTGACNCSKQEVVKNRYGPLGNLKQKVQATT